ncbi:MAG: YceI family protein [Dehalococcoidia bacterium]
MARLNFPSDAVGRTSQITGAIVLAGDTLALPESSRITVDLRTLQSDESRRDRYIQDNTLETRLYPYAEFLPTEVRGLSGSLPAQGEATFQVIGDMTIHGVTQRVTLDITATFSEGEVVGQARTSFRFGDFNMAIPRVMAVLSVEDHIRLEVDFRLTRQKG